VTQQLFPDIDLSRFTENPAQDGQGALPTDAPVGVMAGLNASLLALMANFSPGDLGVCVVDNKLQLTLDVPDWSKWAYVSQGVTPSIDAGSTTNIVLFTVPEDERVWLDGVQVSRNSGDNTWLDIHTLATPDYRSGSGEYHLMHLDTAGADIYWPMVGETSVLHAAGPYPLLLEPGFTVELAPSGAGVSASVASYRIAMRRTKIVRALAP